MAILTTRSELENEEDKIVKLEAFDSNFFPRKSHFEGDVIQNYLVFQSFYKCFKKIANSNYILT